MTKPEWGTKRVCQSCGAPFYDMRRDPIVCPKCGAVFEPENVAKLKRTRPAPAKPAPVSKEVEDEIPSVENDAEIDEDDEEEVLEDASDLEDDDELDEVVKKPDGEED